MIEWFKKVLNIHPDKNQKWILWAESVSMLLYTYSQPILMKEIISNLPSQWLAFESMAISFFALLIGMMWQGKLREKAIKFFLIIAIAESTGGFLLNMYLCFIDFNVWVCAIGSLIYTSFIAIFVGKCIMAFKAKLWVEKDRELYDNNVAIVGGIVCMSGYMLALIAMPSVKTAIFLWGICCILDDIGWVIVYIKNKEKLKKVEKLVE